MSKIKNAFMNGKSLIGFLTAGDPTIEKSEEFILEMIRGGVDLIEIGIPFSDPVAEGIVIQNANIRALSSNTTVDKVFELVKNVRKKVDTPIVLLTYLNPVFAYGYDSFFSNCKMLSVDGIIIPDMPFEEKSEILTTATNYDVDIISLIAPTSEHRINKIAENATGFIYVVSSMGVTGVRNEIKTDLEALLKSIKLAAKIPVAVGFGINTAEQVKSISMLADGVIVGSAIVKIIEKYGVNAGEYIYEYVKSLKDAMHDIS